MHDLWSHKRVHRGRTDLTTNVDISFRSGFAGLKSIYQFAADTGGGTSGWISMGTWVDTGDPNVVELTSLTPNSGTGSSQVFTAVISESNASNITWAQLVMNTSLSGINGCFIHYDRASNVFYLLNNTGTVFAGMFAGSGQVTTASARCTELVPAVRWRDQAHRNLQFELLSWFCWLSEHLHARSR